MNSPNFFVFLLIFLIFYIPINKNYTNGASVMPQGIDSEEGDAETFYNKSYSEHQSALELKIFRNYNPKYRPQKNQSVPTVVDVHWHIVHVSINAKEQTMTAHGHLYMKWFDEFLVWDPKDFNGISYARVKKWQVWQPVIRVANSASGIGSNFDFANNAHVIIQMQEKNRAKIEMYPTFSIRVGCAFDFSEFPNDENKCAINMFATTTMNEVQLQNLYSMPPTLSFGWGEQKLKDIISDFQIKSVTCDQIYYNAGNITKTAPMSASRQSNTFSMIAVYVNFVRHSPMYLAGVVAPCALCALINVVTFFIPKLVLSIQLGITNVLIQYLFFMDAFKKLPIAVAALPLPIKFYGFVMLTNLVSTGIGMILLVCVSKKFQVPDNLKCVYKVQDVMPDTWKDEEMQRNAAQQTKMEYFARTVRPIIGFTLAIIYLLQFFYFL